MPRSTLLGGFAFLLAISCAPAWAQQRITVPNPPLGETNESIQQQKEMQQKLEKMRQKKRYEDMKRDSQKLLELATELNQYVDKTGENVLSMEVVRKAEQMEKLARRVKENMRGD
jgi:predicted Rossmann fold nucleotide-binding protein DprA/Smf involved in DNA uptake